MKEGIMLGVGIGIGFYKFGSDTDSNPDPDGSWFMAIFEAEADKYFLMG